MDVRLKLPIQLHAKALQRRQRRQRHLHQRLQLQQNVTGKLLQSSVSLMLSVERGWRQIALRDSHNTIAKQMDFVILRNRAAYFAQLLCGIKVMNQLPYIPLYLVLHDIVSPCLAYTRLATSSNF